VIVRLIKQIDAKIIISSDSKQAFNASVGVFIMYITTVAAKIAEESRGKKKGIQITPQHVLQALEEMEFKNYLAQVQDFSSLKRKK
jgi:histone H3/H4